MSFPNNPIIVVGGGLAGLSAAHECYLRGSNVVLIDKQGFLSGNSGKATSGINGALTRTQVQLGIKDSVDQFYQDTLASAKDRANPELIKVLTYHSSDAIHWLQEVFGLDLTVVSRLGGHSQPRTHRGHDAKFPGMAITYRLLETLENLSEEQPGRVVILKNTQVVDLLMEGQDTIGVKYKDLKTKEKGVVSGPVIMATGGYAADFTKNSLLRKYRPDIFDLPSTNGVHATGDGQKIMLKNKAIGIDFDKVQVHPTGLIDYDSKDVINGLKQPRFLFLGAEALRGEGGIMLNGRGERFVDELGTRDYVSGEMEKQLKKGQGPIRLILNSKAASKLEFHVKHYQQRNLMRKVTGEELAVDIGVDSLILTKEFDDYNSHNNSTPDQFGKKYFPNTPFTFNTKEEYYVSFVTRVLHFTMGGIKINDKTQVMYQDSEEGNSFKPFKGLYACGEVAGGVHGHNRLGGSSLLACVVFGRLAADQASSFLLKKLSNTLQTKDSQDSNSAVVRLQQINLHIDPQSNRVTINWDGPGSDSNQGKEADGQIASKPPRSPTPGKEEQKQSKSFSIPKKEFTMEEIAKHNKSDDCWCVVKNVVLDLTSFLADHPGGEQSILNFAGKDATESFDMLHEDNVIERYASSCVLGTLKGKASELKF
ncbi:Osmotic growth protein [Yamadazyma tenuis]|uniref:Flavocytochrome c n=1 Tax=Candida tenuis (strain ATCC 10573 / BCRC 21748 / CBS 615 / JCM 9827 / NBRC 10315 / NRRL Y-1498 / VKM Y-70) TaxID=590646 RepID=G3B5R0_CANTC|nr:Flavocytochrome c [Yamadazyma tenuis ATCC 10573]EGV63285.1 Flavocytochrome c [Yamadazyma tenuis ATCC 10573]WEJ96899.1 Osmotic growth protein [Yamadazyma tenuis]